MDGCSQALINQLADQMAAEATRQDYSEDALQESGFTLVAEEDGHKVWAKSYAGGEGLRIAISDPPAYGMGSASRN